MPISIRIARTARQLDQAYQVRHQVYVEEEHRFAPRPDRRIYDRFDCFPGTCSIVATDVRSKGSLPVGTVRFAMKDELGLPSDGFYDFSEIIKRSEPMGRVATLGMLAVAQRYRARRGLLPGMVKVAWRELRRTGARFLVAPVSPDAEVILLAMGAEQVGDPFEYGDPPVHITPLFLDMEKLSPAFREMAVDPQNILFDDLDERRLYRQRARIIHEGESGDEAFLIMRGTARLFRGDPDEPSSAYMLGPGEIFGELALMGGSEHPASVDVHSKLLDVAVIPRDRFQDRLAKDTSFAQRMLNILGRRIRSLLLGMPPDTMMQVGKEAIAAGILLEVSELAVKPVEASFLAADSGLTPEEFDALIETWSKAGAVRRNDQGQIEVTSVEMLRVLVDHVVETAALLREFSPDGAGKPSGP